MKSFIPDKVYDILKWIVIIALPAISALYFGLAEIWHFPFAEEIVGTISFVTAFIGALLGISTIQYNSKGGE